MTTAYLCVVVAFLLNFASKAPVALAMQRMPGGYDNRTPRDQQARLEGWGRRAMAAHLNCFEAFPGFAVAVLMAAATGADPVWIGRLAVAFVVARLLYIVFYLADVHALRSAVWTVGLGTNLAIFAVAVRAAM